MRSRGQRESRPAARVVPPLRGVDASLGTCFTFAPNWICQVCPAMGPHAWPRVENVGVDLGIRDHLLQEGVGNVGRREVSKDLCAIEIGKAT